MLTGTEALLKSSLIAAIEAAILAQVGSAPIAPKAISGLSEGIANAIVPHIVSNLQILAGTAVLVGAHAPGGAAVGATTAPGIPI